MEMIETEIAMNFNTGHFTFSHISIQMFLDFPFCFMIVHIHTFLNFSSIR